GPARSGVAAADHHDMLAARQNRLIRADRLARHAAVLLGQEVHREVNAGEIAAGRGEIARRFGAARECDRVVAVEDVPRADRPADMSAVVKDDAFGLHLRDAALDVELFQLEVRDAIAQQAARLGVLLIDVNLVTGARELLGAGETGRARPDDGDPLAGLALGQLRLHPSFLEGAVDDRAFDGLDRDRRVLEVERAGGLAWRWADAAGEFGEVVGRQQVARRLAPVGPVDEVVPVRDLVVDRAADVAIRDAAIHAAGGLIAGRLFAQRQHELAIMADTVGGRRITPVRAIDLEKSCDLSHLATPESGRRSQSLRPSSGPLQLCASLIWQELRRRRRLRPPIAEATFREARIEPLAAPTAVAFVVALLSRGQHRRLALRGEFRQRASIFDRHHLAELRQIGLPVFQDAPRAGRAGQARVVDNQLVQAL